MFVDMSFESDVRPARRKREKFPNFFPQKSLDIKIAFFPTLIISRRSRHFATHHHSETMKLALFALLGMACTLQLANASNTLESISEVDDLYVAGRDSFQDFDDQDISLEEFCEQVLFEKRGDVEIPEFLIDQVRNLGKDKKKDEKKKDEKKDGKKKDEKKPKQTSSPSGGGGGKNKKRNRRRI